ncbi:MAG TPA: riboflavin synthase [Casimicrobiaceae bacterium]|nr:riboflavin synthase [Casimicrobiaceae bacterium]
MFTGIVQATGRIAARDGAADGVRVRIDAAALGVADIAVGDSIAVGGCCLTVVAIDAHVLAFDVSAETLACTAGFDVGREVNLEKSLRLSDRLGGHLVSGHVDGVGVVAAFAAVSTDAQGSWYLSIDAPVALARYIASKGSIAVDGVSLTVNGVDGARFTVNLIPHTLAATTLRQLAVGRPVNLEVDVIARYVERLRSAPSPLPTKE